MSKLVEAQPISFTTFGVMVVDNQDIPLKNEHPVEVISLADLDPEIFLPIPPLRPQIAVLASPHEASDSKDSAECNQQESALVCVRAHILTI